MRVVLMLVAYIAWTAVVVWMQPPGGQAATYAFGVWLLGVVVALLVWWSRDLLLFSWDDESDDHGLSAERDRGELHLGLILGFLLVSAVLAIPMLCWDAARSSVRRYRTWRAWRTRDRWMTPTQAQERLGSLGRR